MDHFDYIIVGAGSAGCVLANRLTEDGKTSVLLLEAGGRGKHPLVRMPKGISKVMADPRMIWPYMTKPQPTSNDASESWARGRMLGGSSSVNGMVYVRGQDADFDALAETTSSDWNWSEIGKAYKALENHELGAGETRGDNGPLGISLPPVKTDLAEAAIQAGEALGLKRLDDVNSPEDIERVGYVPATIQNGRRQSAAEAFLKPVRRRPNLCIETNVVVDTLLFDGHRVTGVKAIQNGQPAEYHASGEVILTAGALATPAILERSGIGNADILSAMGIEVKVNSSQVGERVREHRGVVMQWEVEADFSQNDQYRGLKLFRNGLAYFLGATNAMSTAAYDVGAWFKSNPAELRPDGQILVAPFTFDYGAPTFRVEKHGGMNFSVYVLRPQSTGRVHIVSRDPGSLPVIEPNYTTDESDEQRMIDCFRFARRFAEQPSLSKFVIRETRPGPDYRSDDELKDALREFGYGAYHACGSCHMGSTNDAPVDAELRVRGVDGLRVVDTSVFPEMMSGNTNGPAMAIAWRAADIIRRGSVQG